MSTDIPIIDYQQVSTSPETVAQELLQACADWGFFYVKNHPIPQVAVDGIFDLEKRFFAQPLETKLQAPYIPAKNAGFKPASSNGAYGTFKDPREAFSINKWPTATDASGAPLSPILNEARDQIQSFQKQVQSFTRRLLELIAQALDLPRDQFTAQHDPDAINFDNFELMHYPPVAQLSTTTAAAAAGQNVAKFRISPHTDWGTLTLLFQQSIGGLQVRPPHYTAPELDLNNETWTPAPVFNDMVLINIGDMLEFWTAGALKSTWHRVVPTAAHGGVDRYTFAYFLHPNKDAVLVPIEAMKRDGWIPRYAGIGRTAEAHIHARIAGVHGKKQENGQAKVESTQQNMVVKEVAA
ncbi:uncharacterized protein PV06_01806 [Exophiala oligosperma]|uniref:Fe2OG dioxygenase domain-containing protein n=2 Tax=Chaetothyriales TaxID=34395 RepID=A0A0D2B1S7_9EURO|nr:uncharacterized protein PV06_01806 [Exophiala oligosperma]KAJ9611847.1 hypothetical protein H2204_015145 [Knufia peltigerae]KIW46116.1 hypothetical protein PV06_01806 [Exophiala oligosperma]